MMKNKDAVKVLASLASEPRLLVFKEIIKHGISGVCPCVIAEILDIPRNTLSFHLKTLKTAGLITSRRKSKNLFYSPKMKQMKDVIEYLLKDCCAEEFIRNKPCLRRRK